MPTNVPALTEFKVKSAPAGEYPDGMSPGLRLIVSTTGAKSWEYRFRLHGRLRRMRIGRYPGMTLKAAREAWSDESKLRNKGVDPLEKRADERAASAQETQRKVLVRKVEQYTVRRMIDEYVDHISRLNKTWAQAGYYLDRYLIPELGGAAAGDVHRKSCIAILDGIHASGRIVDRNRTKSYAHSCWAWAIERERPGVVVNPWSGIKQIPEVARDHVVTDDELRRILRWLPESGIAPVGRDALLFVFMMGTRVGETTALRSEFVDRNVTIALETRKRGARDIDVEVWRGHTLTIPGSMTKNGRDHMLMLSRQAFALIEPRLDREYLFPSQRGGHYRSNSISSELARRFNTLTNVRAFVPHDARRTLATWAGEHDCPEPVIQRMLNHTAKSSDVTRRVYNRAKLDKQAAVWWQRWADHLTALESSNVVELRA